MTATTEPLAAIECSDASNRVVHGGARIVTRMRASTTVRDLGAIAKSTRTTMRSAP